MPDSEIALRKKNNQDYHNAATWISEQVDIEPWSLNQVSSLINASRRVDGLSIYKNGRTPVISHSDLLNWFNNRILQTTVALSWEDYEEALGMGLYDILISELDQTDMGGIRQRSLAQHLENALTGYLAEVSVAKFLEQRGLDSVELDLGRTASLEDMVGSDIARVVRDGTKKRPNISIQIKKSKPRASWLPIPEKGETPPDVFILCRVGPRYEHLLQYFNSLGITEVMTNSLSSEKQKQVLKGIPKSKPIPTHVSGYVNWSDLESGELEVNEKRKNAHIVGGIGNIPGKIPGYGRPRVVGLNNPSENFLAAVSSLRNTPEDWRELITSL